MTQGCFVVMGENWKGDGGKQRGSHEHIHGVLGINFTIAFYLLPTAIMFFRILLVVLRRGDAA